MRQSNYPLFDFLDLDDIHGDVLWKACNPTDIAQSGEAVVINIPFKKEKVLNEISTDGQPTRVHHQMKLTAYGDQVLRISIGFGVSVMEESPMLELASELKITPLHVHRADKKWIVKDAKGKARAIINLAPPETDHWSDLLPSPDETFDATFFIDGNREVRISAYDQFFPSRNDAMALAYVETQGQPARASLSFGANADEKFVGTGERFAKMDLSGHTFQLRNQDGQGVNNRRTYKNIPFYLSSKMYGMFLHTSAYAKFSLADHSTRSVQLLVDEPVLDVFLMAGESPEEILFLYRELTGFPPLPPLWSFGIWMSRMSYFSANEVNEVCNRLRQEDFPCDVIHLDTGWFRKDWLCEWKFNPERFPDPEGFISDLRKKGFRISLWQLPYITSGAEQHDEAIRNRYVGIPNGKGGKGSSNFSVLDYAGTIDFTYPQAVKWYQKLLSDLLDMGVVCIKTDFGEEIHLDATYHGMKPDLLNNLYALLYQKAAYEVTREVTGEGIIWARAAWAGCQRYPLHWGGDAAASWDGMAGSLKGGLHLGLSGFGFWSHDVPGFHGVPDFMNAIIPDDLYVRWTQFGVFTSHIRYHGTSKREPYHYPAIAGIIRRWWKLRYALIPYVVAQSRKTTESGYPVLRALLFHHPDDKTCWHIDDQYYFGDDFLVAPVMNSQNRRDVYLPEGEWVDFFNGNVIQGPVWLKNFEVSLDEMPVWARSGADIQLYLDHVSCTDEMDLSRTDIVTVGNDFGGIWKHLSLR